MLVAALGCAEPTDRPVDLLDPGAGCEVGAACVVAGVPGMAGDLPDGRSAIATWLYQPQDVTPALDGFYVADTNNHVVRWVDAVGDDGVATVIAGSGYPDFGTGGLAVDEPLHTPCAIVPDPFDPDTLWIAVPDGHRIARLRGVVDGDGDGHGDGDGPWIDYPYGVGDAGFDGDGGPAALALFNRPASLAFDAAGALYVADRMNQVVRRIDPVDGTVRTVVGVPGVRGYAGDGGPADEALLNAPVGSERDPGNRIAIAGEPGHERLLIADTGNGALRSVDLSAAPGGPHPEPFTITTLAAGLSSPHDVAVAADGAILVSETGAACVRRVAPDGAVSTVIGVCGAPGQTVPDALATEVQLTMPTGIAADADGGVWVTDIVNNVVVWVPAALTD